MANNNQILNRLFTLNSFNELLQYGSNSVYSAAIKKYVDSPYIKKNSEIFSELYDYLAQSYRNEYYFENTILNRLLLQIHNPSTTTALSQVPIGKSIADFVLINGKAVVYEIKTGLDSFDRLESQVNDYFKAFTRVSVITTEQQYERVSRLLENTSVGVYVLTSRDTISRTLRKEPIEDTTSLNHTVLFKMLRKKEYENIIKSYYSILPDTTQVLYYRECLQKFCDIPMQQLYEMVLKELKKRVVISRSELVSIPYELRSLYYFSRPNSKSADALRLFMNNDFGG